MPAWASRNVVVLLAGQWVSQAGNVLFALALYWTVLRLSHSRLDLGLAGTGVGLAGVLGLLGGVLADRWHRRRTLLAADAIRAAACLAMAGLALAHHITEAILIGGAFLLEAVGSLFGPALSSLLTILARPEDVAVLFGVQSSSTYTATFAGNAVAGILLAAVGTGGVFLADGGSFVLSLLGIFALRLPEEDASARRTAAAPFLQSLAQGLDMLRRVPALGRLTLLIAALLVTGAPVEILGASWVESELHRGALRSASWGRRSPWAPSWGASRARRSPGAWAPPAWWRWGRSPAGSPLWSCRGRQASGCRSPCTS